MKVIVTGASGQVGRELQLTCPDGVEIVPLGRGELNICEHAAAAQVVASANAQVLINCAAYTAVDAAEADQAIAFAVNAEAPAKLALAAKAAGLRFIHLSTDFVFDGTKSTPYLPDDAPHPLSVYGASKLQGELGVQENLDGAGLVVRSAWIYSPFGGNFVKTMLRLMRERDHLNVVCDQVGTPTRARGLALALWRAVERPQLKGILHWTDAGVASWYDFAVAVQEEAMALGLLNKAVPLCPVRSTEFKTAAARPSFSILDKTASWAALDISAPQHWRIALREHLRQARPDQG